MGHPQRNIRKDNHNPGEQNETLNIGDSPGGQWPDRIHNCQEPGYRDRYISTALMLIWWSPVPCHQYQGVYWHIGRHIDDVLDSPAPGQTKRPEHEDVVTGGGRDTHQDEQQVCHRQVQNQQVGCVLHLGIAVHLQFW